MAIKKLNVYDMDTVLEQSGYDSERTPDSTRGNMAKVIEKINELVSVVNEMKGREDD